MNMKYSVIVPCYNEELNIHGLIKRLEQEKGSRNVEYIMVENGSKDKTREYLERECSERADFKIAYVDENLGYGYGVVQGMKAATGDYIGWIHADLQVSPKEMMRFIDYIERDATGQKFFLKGVRDSRSVVEHIFTAGMTAYVTLMLGQYLYDIGAIPVLFHRSLLDQMDERIPYDFAIETYVYDKAKRSDLVVKRFRIHMGKREKGASSWNKGFFSKIRQSKVIMGDVLKIRKGEAVR